MKFLKVYEETMATVWAHEQIPARDFNQEMNPKNIKSTGFTDIGNSASIYAKELLGPKTKGIKSTGTSKIASSKRKYEE